MENRDNKQKKSNQRSERSPKEVNRNERKEYNPNRENRSNSFNRENTNPYQNNPNQRDRNNSKPFERNSRPQQDEFQRFNRNPKEKSNYEFRPHQNKEQRFGNNENSWKKGRSNDMGFEKGRKPNNQYERKDSFEERSDFEYQNRGKGFERRNKPRDYEDKNNQPIQNFRRENKKYPQQSRRNNENLNNQDFDMDDMPEQERKFHHDKENKLKYSKKMESTNSDEEVILDEEIKQKPVFSRDKKQPQPQENKFKKKEKENKISEKQNKTKDFELENENEEITQEDIKSMFETAERSETKEGKQKKPEEVEEKDDPKIKRDYLYGTHAVEVALQSNLRKIQKLFVLNSHKINPSSNINKLIKIALNKNIQVYFLTKGKLDRLSNNRPNNGVVLACELRKYLELKLFSEFKEKYLKKTKGNLTVLVDKVNDPQNLGSIIRSSFFIGADHIILNKQNSPPISPAVAKVSSGASEFYDLFAVKFVKNFLENAKAEGWMIITTGISEDENLINLSKPNPSDVDDKHKLDIEEKAVDEVKQSSLSQDQQLNPTANDSYLQSKKPSNEKTDLRKLKVSPEDNVIVVFGNENEGISENIFKISNFNVYIPPVLDEKNQGVFPYDIIDSLNVGVSAGIILNHIKGQQISKNDLNKNI